MQPKEETKDFQDKQEPEKKLTREQRRHIERVNQEVTIAIEQQAEKFLKFFTTCDNPEGPEVAEKVKQMDAQWRTYCGRKRLMPKAFPLLKKYCESVIEQYQKEKAV